MYRIMIVEDDISISELLKKHIEKYGFECWICSNFDDITTEFIKYDPNLVLLDVNLPKFDGFYWCRQIRNISKCPIIFISARTGDLEQIYAMDNGADDYITKPFSFEIVVSKINANIRRAYGDYAEVKTERTKALGDLKLFCESFTLENKTKKTTLTKKEVELLSILMDNYPKVISRQKLLTAIWDNETFVEENTLNVNIARIRRKIIEIDANFEIEAVRGVGYKLVEVV